MKKYILLLITLLSLVTFTACKKDKTVKISFDKEEVEVLVGEQITLKPSIQLGKDVKEHKIVYSASNDNVTVTNDGTLKGVKEGETIVTVKEEISSTTASIKVVVKQAVVETVYSINYSLDGGVLPEGAITSFKNPSEVQLPIPTKEGYNFLGWYEGETKVETLTLKDYNLVAVWEKQLETYAINYDVNGGVLPEGVTVEFKEGSAASVELPIPTKENYIFVGWYEGENKVDALSENKDYNLVAHWEIVTYEVLFDANGGSAVDSQEVAFGELVTKPTDPTLEGYTFVEWQLGGVTYDFNTPVTAELTLVAVWEKVLATYTITYTLNSGKLPTDAVRSFVEDTYQDVVLPVPTRNGYDFIGWYEGETKIEVLTENKDYKLSAKWEGQTKQITYHLNDGVLPVDAPSTFKVGEITILPIPTREGYTFVGWYANAECTGNKVTQIAKTTIKDVVYYAAWEIETFTITYDLNNGNWSYTTREEIVEDFLKDAMAKYGVTSKPDGMVHGAGETKVGFANKFAAIYGIFTDPTYATKWAWLKEYIINVTTVENSKTQLQNGDEVFWRYSLGAFLFEEHRSSYPVSADFTIKANANGFWETLSQNEKTVFEGNTTTVTLQTPVRPYYIFNGWYLTEDFVGDPITTINETATVYAKWTEEVPVEAVTITNKKDKMDRFETLQLEWELTPSNAAIKEVEFSSSDESVATVDTNGVITALNNGTVTITILSLSPSGVSDAVTIEVSSPDHFDVKYETNSYVALGGKINLLAEYVKRDYTNVTLSWKSLNTDIATVNTSGTVTGVKSGTATIRVSVVNDETTFFDFQVVVLPATISYGLQHVINSHESNIFTRYELGIGAGTPVYYADILGSVNKMLYNYNYFWNTKHLDACVANGQFSTGIDKVEFIVVHYTAGMTKGSNAEATAKFFSSNKNASAHFCTGNDGVFQTLRLTDRGWHAGDGASAAFTWTDSGVAYNENDPKFPVFGISQNAKFTINGKETTISVPKKEQNGNTGYVTDSKWLNSQGLAYKIENGKYMIGTTWWCYSNVWEGRICSRGGNRYGIGIESAVDFGSDLWLTWQITAQLVADLMVKYNLDIHRVKGHQFFAGKDCPQPLLENDLEIWWEFIELVEAEYIKMTTLKDYTFSFTAQEGSELVNENGRIISQPEYSEVVTYKVTVQNGTQTEEITLPTIVPGIYTK